MPNEAGELKLEVGRVELRIPGHVEAGMRHGQAGMTLLRAIIVAHSYPNS